MLIAQISDCHLMPEGERTRQGIDTNRRLADAVAHLNRLRPRPDLVLVTGDLCEDASPGAHRAAAERLKRLEAPFFVIPGNHDDRDQLRACFGTDQGGAYLPAGGFLHYAIEDRPLRLIGLDTLEPSGAAGALCAERIAWLAAALAAVPGRPTVLFMHHPPAPIGLRFMDAINCQGADALADVVARQPQVEAILCGHVHRPVTVAWRGTRVITAPATGYQIVLDLGRDGFTGISPEPPAFLLHLWDPDQGLTTHISPIG